MVSISNADAALIQALLERGSRFYRDHAVRPPDINDARLMAKMSKKLKVNRAAAQSQPQK
jgi:hypothetical protein